MDNNVVNMRGERIPLNPTADFKISLKTPFNFGLPPTQILAAEVLKKKPGVLRKLRGKFYTAKKFAWEKIIRPTRDFFYRIESNKAFGDLAALSLKLNRSDFHVSLDLSGHVDRIIIRVHLGGWAEGNKGRCIKVIDGTLPGRYKYGKMKPRDLREAMKIIKSLSKQNHLYPKNKL